MRVWFTKKRASKRVHQSYDTETSTEDDLVLPDTSDEDRVDWDKFYPEGTYMSDEESNQPLANPGTKAFTASFRGPKPAPQNKKPPKKTKKLEFNVTQNLPKKTNKKQKK